MISPLLQAAEARLAAAGIDTARFEAQLLLALTLGVTRTQVLAGTHPSPTPEQESAYSALVARRAQRIPLAYLRGTQEFYGLEFEVTPAVLIPRPETELLVEQALLRLRERLNQQRAGRETVWLADVGTGSGCIVVSTLVNLPQARAVATDLSAAALAVATRNARRHGVTDRLNLLQTDLLIPVVADTLDVIVSNPPYIPSGEIPTLQPEVRDREPHLALDGGPDGLLLHRRLVSQAFQALRSGGWLCVEVAQGQSDAVGALFTQAGFQQVAALADLAGIARTVCGCRP